MKISHFWVRRKNELKKLRLNWRSFLASFAQRRMARNMDLDAAEELVVFFVPTVYDCNGGVMSIASLSAITRRLKPNAKVVTATVPGEPTAVKNRLFPNDEVVLTLPIIRAHAHPKKLLMHLPELACADFAPSLSKADREWIRSIPDVHINILNQNLDLMPPKEAWNNLFELTEKVTQTTAHESTGTQETCNRFGIPLHHFSVNLDHSWWPYKPFAEKEKLIVFSPDPNEWEPKVRAAIKRDLPEYRIEVVHDMTFTEYLDLVARAKFVISFGEAFDGYFIQPYTCGTIGIAAYIEKFFPSPEWKTLDSVYASYEDMVNRFTQDVRRWEQSEADYAATIADFKSRKAKLYFDDALEGNMKRFYEGTYDHYPQKE